MKPTSEIMRVTDLLAIPQRKSEAVLAALGQAAEVYDDNGGQPDGTGDLLAPVCFAEQFGTLEAALAAGAYQTSGYEVPYIEQLDARATGLVGFDWCGYSARDAAYIKDIPTETGKAIRAFVRAQIEAALTREDCDAWHDGRRTDNLDRLIEAFGAFNLWGTVDPQGTEEPLSIDWPA
jgi:hypothetical protein